MSSICRQTLKRKLVVVENGKLCGLSAKDFSKNPTRNKRPGPRRGVQSDRGKLLFGPETLFLVNPPLARQRAAYLKIV